MSVEILSLGYTDPPAGCEKKRWWQVFGPFETRAAYHAANLAAHDWDVLLVDGRVFLFQTRYGGDLGHWLNTDGTREDASHKQMRELYTRAKNRRFTARAAINAATGGQQ
jgi:hypothetical protein